MDLGMALDGIEEAKKIAMAQSTAGAYARSVEGPEGTDVIDSPL